jgi:hypothetical protein
VAYFDQRHSSFAFSMRFVDCGYASWLGYHAPDAKVFDEEYVDRELLAFVDAVPKMFVYFSRTLTPEMREFFLEGGIIRAGECRLCGITSDLQEASAEERARAQEWLEKLCDPCADAEGRLSITHMGGLCISGSTATWAAIEHALYWPVWSLLRARELVLKHRKEIAEAFYARRPFQMDDIQLPLVPLEDRVHLALDTIKTIGE